METSKASTAARVLLLVSCSALTACSLDVAGRDATPRGGAPAPGGEPSATADASAPTTSAGATSFVLGDATVEGNVAIVAPGLANAFAYSASRSTVVTSMSLYADASSAMAHVQVGLYDDVDDHPNARLAVLDFAVAPGQWSTASLSAPVAVTQGRHYWLGLLALPGSASGSLAIRVRGGGQSNQQLTFGLSSLPAKWGSGATTTDGPASVYLF